MSVSMEETKISPFDYYFCPICNKIPRITLGEDLTINIKCKHHSSFNINELREIKEENKMEINLPIINPMKEEKKEIKINEEEKSNENQNLEIMKEKEEKNEEKKKDEEKEENKESFEENPSKNEEKNSEIIVPSNSKKSQMEEENNSSVHMPIESENSKENNNPINSGASENNILSESNENNEEEGEENNSMEIEENDESQSQGSYLDYSYEDNEGEGQEQTSISYDSHESNIISKDLSLEEFISQFPIIKKENYCEGEELNIEHSSVKGEACCTVCKKWFCSKCLKNHLKNNKDHEFIFSEGFIPNSRCENPFCNEHKKIEFYCKRCNLQLCENCILKHPHMSILSLKEEKRCYGELELAHLIKDQKERANKNKEIFENLFKDLEDKINNCRKMIKEKLEEDEKIYIFLNSLINTSFKANGIFNYNIKKNLSVNTDNVCVIFNLRETELMKQFSKELSMDPFLTAEFSKAKNIYQQKEEIKFEGTVTKLKEVPNIFGNTEWFSILFVKTECPSHNDKLIFGGRQKDIAVYQYNNKINNFEYENVMKGHNGNIYSLCEIQLDKTKKCRRDNTFILSGSDDGTIKLWNFHNYQMMLSINAHEGPINKIIQVRHKNNIISCSDDETVKVWNIETSPVNLSYKLNFKLTSKVFSVAYVGNDWFISVSDGNNPNENSIKLWHLGYFDCGNIIESSGCSGINTFAYSKDFGLMYSVNNTKLKVLTRGGQKLGEIDFDENCSCLNAFPGKMTLVGTESGKLFSISKNNTDEFIKTEIEYQSIFQNNSNVEQRGKITCISYLNENKFITSDNLGRIVIWKY